EIDPSTPDTGARFVGSGHVSIDTAVGDARAAQRARTTDEDLRIVKFSHSFHADDYRPSSVLFAVREELRRVLNIERSGHDRADPHERSPTLSRSNVGTKVTARPRSA